MKRIIKILVFILLGIIGINTVNAFSIPDEQLNQYFSSEYEVEEINGTIVHTKDMNGYKQEISYTDYSVDERKEGLEKYYSYCVKEEKIEYESYEMIDNYKGSEYYHKSCTFQFKKSTMNEYTTVYFIDSSLIVGRSDIKNKAELDDIMNKILSDNYVKPYDKLLADKKEEEEERKQAEKEAAKNEENKEEQPKEQEKKNTNSLINIVLTIVIVLALLVIAVAVINGRKKEVKENDEKRDIE